MRHPKSLFVHCQGLAVAALTAGALASVHCSSSDEGPGAGVSTGGGTANGGTANGGAATGGTPVAGGGPGATGGGAGTGGITANGGAASGGIGATGGTPASGGQGTGTGGSSAGGSGGAAGNGTDTGPFPTITDFAKDGSFTSTTNAASGPNGNYSVYSPTTLPTNGAKSPIIGWMSGGATTPSGYPMLPRLATQGFFVVASNTAPAIGAEVALGQEIIAGIDWAIAENARKDSPFFGKLDTTKIASMGYSMGSLATFTIANDPRLTTTVHISGGNMEADRIKNLHAPAQFLCGATGDSSCNILSGDCDIAAANCDTDFTNATTPVFYGKFPGGHLGVLTPPNADRIQATAAAWLRWKLMADQTLAKMFVGDQCTVCKDPNWKVQQKNLQ